jgi:hypothetical protein
MMKDMSLEELLDDLSFYSDVSDEHYKIQAEILLRFENLKCCGNCNGSYTTDKDACFCARYLKLTKASRYCSSWTTDGMTREEREK